ncbi:MAG TPA: nitroreductase [Burkholderiales bacterium]|nr:nitroreductase [Burkholderiales bacterium]
MEFEELVRNRYSCRKFLPGAVPRPVIEKILDLAQQTPSWCNVQPWQVLLVSGAAVAGFRESLLAHAASGHPSKPDFAFPLRYEGIYRERRKVCGVQLYQALSIGRENREGAERQRLENFRFFDAPHVALITTEEDLGVYGAVDCGLYVANFMLAAKNFGVDSIAQAALASYPDFIRSRFDLPSNRKLVCGISFGYADADHPIHRYRTERSSLGEAVKFIE